MKIVYICCLLIAGTFNTFSQELNFNDMIYIFTNREDLDKSDSYLVKKKFEYLEYKNGYYVFTFNRGINKNAEAFVYISTENIALQTIKRTTFDYYKQIAATYKLKLTENGADEMGNMVLTYQNEKFYLSLTQGLDEGGSGRTSYLIFFAIW